jgi:leucyl aminopeptidase
MTLPTLPALLVSDADNAIPIECLTPQQWGARKARLSAAHAARAQRQLFEAKTGQVLLLETSSGIVRVIAGAQDSDGVALGASIASQLPQGTYRFVKGVGTRQLYNAALGWLLAHYRFDRYLSAPKPLIERKLVVSDASVAECAQGDAAATWLVRDLVNTPAQDMKPSDIEAAARDLAGAFGADVSSIVGDDLLDQNFPTIHAVGRAAADAPRLIDLHWGKASDPKITLVGKGVSFDSGGLNIKTGNGMSLMKKDMGGAAHVLGLAHRIMQAQLPVRLRVLVPAVENAIAGDAFRPGDIIRSRKGISIEIGNTDAEGRLILCDALALADEEKPDYLIDFATLTGAARVALGPDLAPMYSTDDAFADQTLKAAHTLNDPIWRMPLYQPYMPMLASHVADTSNISDGGFAGSITAALFLQKFVTKSPSWTHLDVYAWSPKNRPGHPIGGNAFAIRAIFNVLAQQYTP